MDNNNNNNKYILFDAPHQFGRCFDDSMFFTFWKVPFCFGKKEMNELEIEGQWG